MKSVNLRRVFLVALVICLALPLSAMAADKLIVKDAGGTNTVFVVQDTGATSIGTSSSIYPLYMTSDIAGSVPAGVGMAMLIGNSNKERMEIRSAGAVNLQAPVLQGKGFGGTIAAPTATVSGHNLFMLGGSGYDGTQIVTGNKALIKIIAGENWSSTAQGTAITFETTANGGTARTEKMRIGGNGAVTMTGLAGTYVNGSAYVCVNNAGQLFTSETGCP